MWYEYLYIFWVLFWFGLFVYSIGRYTFQALQDMKRRQDVCRDCPFFPYQQKKTERREGARRSDRA